MAGSPGLDYVVETAERVWQMQPHRNVRIPVAGNDPVAVNAIWTDYGLRPSATNLAFMVQAVPPQEMNQWKRWLRDWPVRAGLLISDGTYLLQYYEPSGKLEELEIEPDSLAVELTAPRSRLFTPKALAEFRTGQLSLADLASPLYFDNEPSSIEHFKRQFGERLKRLVFQISENIHKASSPLAQR